jgi:hypothetical protein
MMAHYAYLDHNNVVVAVTVGKDENELIDGLETETYYAQGTPYTVKRCSYNNRMRKQYPGIGFFYDPNADVFIAPQPFPSWTLDSNHDWQAPKPRPIEGFWRWNEELLDWVEVEPSHRQS